MTYDEISATFGITRNSARQLVQRKRWMKRKGNDGKVRADVPLEALPAPDEMLREMPHEDAHEAPQTHLLKHVIERLEVELAELRPKALERDVLAALLEAEKRRSDELRQERDRWAVQAHALAHPLPPPAPAPRPSRGLFGWLRAARR